MKTETLPKPIHLKDYRPPDFSITEVELFFDLYDDSCRVRSRLACSRKNPDPKVPFVLDGDDLTPVRVKLDGRELGLIDYAFDEKHLRIENVPDQFTLEIETTLEPAKNLSFEGLYKSGGMFCTQCEAESFRKITYFLDRPDSMSVYTVHIEADRAKYPVLLANGNPISRTELPNGRHQVVWHDPFKKPCYLFALVAGDLGMIEDQFVTASLREITLRIYMRKGFEARCRHAMDSLKWAMKWDQDTYGLEYDLDIYMIVVADDFNMGAMENKGLNIFNANYILADARTATDHDFEAISAVVAHEYFHNWTGNRVTCRDWFQLSLKEGLTVFRDQRFSADLYSPAVRRIEAVIRLRTQQFAEDAGPMAHPIRPQSYISIDNFYTTTVYEKGAEVIRMIETLVGREGFRRGMNLYFHRHDGQAVTTEDFVAAMADANQIDLRQFKNWYDQAGTPIIHVTSLHDPEAATLRLTVKQTCPPTPGQDVKKPFHMPLAVGLIGADGKDLPLQMYTQDEDRPEATGSISESVVGPDGQHTLVLHLRKAEHEFNFNGVKSRPVLSLFRGFSAPIRLEQETSDQDLAFQLKHDSDPFCRWEAAQRLAVRVTSDLISGKGDSAAKIFTDAFSTLLDDDSADPAFVSYLLTLPAESYLAQFFQPINFEAISGARESLRIALGRAHCARFERIYGRSLSPGSPAQMIGGRALKNTALSYLLVDEPKSVINLALEQMRNAKTMSEEMGALEAMTHLEAPERDQALLEFYANWKHEALVINKWFMVQAISRRKDTLSRIQKLSRDPSFDANNPNKIYALYAAFCRFNLLRFHSADGAGYRLIADQVMEIDGRNPQVASRLMGGFGQWRVLDTGRQSLIKAEVNRILAKPGLSSNVFELASKTLEV